MAELVLDSMLRIPEFLLTAAQLNHVERAFTLKLPESSSFGFGDGGPRVLRIYTKKDGVISIPRNSPLAREMLRSNSFSDQRTLGRKVDLKFLRIFRKGQKEFVCELVESLKRDGLGTIGQAACGFGKTVSAMGAIAEMDTTTLILVHKEALMKQFVAAAETFLGETPGIVQGDTCDYQRKKIVVGMIQSLYKRDYGQEFENYFGLMVTDECLTGDALVITDIGEVEIQDIPSSGATSVLSFDEHTEEWEAKPILRWIPKGKQDTVAVTLEKGHELKCTVDHLVRTTRGWVPAGELVPGDLVLSPADADAGRRYRPSEQTGSQESSFKATRTSGGGFPKPLKNTGGKSSKRSPPTVGASAENGSNSHQASNELVEPCLSGPNFFQATGRPEFHGPPLRRRLLGDSTGHSWATARLQDPTSPLHQEFLTITQQSNKLTRITKQADSKGWGCYSKLSLTRDTGNSLEEGPVSATRGLRSSSVQSGSPKKLPQDGLSKSHQRGGPGGTWMTDQLIPKYLISHSIQKGKPPKGLDASSRFSRGKVTVPRSRLIDPMRCSDWVKRIRSSGSKHTLNTVPLAWSTNFLRVNSVGRGITEFVFDIEVADNHNFVANGLLVHNCHHIAAPMFSTAANKIKAKYRVGLTATPRRGDKMEDVFFWHIGDIGAVGEGDYLDCTVYVIEYTPLLTSNQWNFRGKPNLGRLITALSQIDERNAILCRLIAEAVRKGRSTLVLSDRVAHIEAMATALRKGFKRAGEEYTVGIYGAGSTKKARSQRQTAAFCDVTLGTNAMAAEGLDLPHKDTLFLTTPKADVEQAVGRIRRLYEGKRPPMVIDIRDNIGFLGRFANKREQFYMSHAQDKQPWLVKRISGAATAR